ncbi:UNVERIFIED_ORG: hypothetical protein B2H93_16705 [Clostridium botulinum]
MSILKQLNTTGGKLNVDKDKIKDNNSKKMELLQKQFIQKNKELIKKNKNKENIISDQQRVVKKKVTSDKYKEKYTEVNKALKEYRNKFKNSEKENKILKDINKKKDEIIKSDKLYIIELENQIKVFKKDITNKNDKIDYYENSYYKKTYNMLLNEINMLKTRNYELSIIIRSNKSRISTQKYQIEKLLNDIKILKEGFCNVENKILIESLNKRINKLVWANSELRQELKVKEKSTYEKCKNLIDENIKLKQSHKLYSNQYHVNKNKKTQKKIGTLKTIGIFAYFESIFWKSMDS